MEAIDPARIDWTRVRAVTYRIEQTLSYEYERPIVDLRHRLVISPRALHGDQRRLTHRLTTSLGIPCPTAVDRFGNTVAELAIPRVERSLAFSLESTVRRQQRPGAYRIRPVALRDAAWSEPRRLVRPDVALTAIAHDLRACYPDDADLAEAIVCFVHRAMIYTKGVTDVFTTASVALRMGRGVCQDYAHVAIAIARVCGLPARYVSGHLLGEGATHAWVEFLVPAGDDRLRVLSFDPTYRCATTLRYVTVAVGRDYSDVAPTSGTFKGSSSGVLQGRQFVAVTSIEAA